MASKPGTPCELAAADGYALLRLKANIHRRTEYYRTATSDPHQINQALYIALLEMENAITETVSDVKAHERISYERP